MPEHDTIDYSGYADEICKHGKAVDRTGCRRCENELEPDERVGNCKKCGSSYNCRKKRCCSGCAHPLTFVRS